MIVHRASMRAEPAVTAGRVTGLSDRVVKGLVCAKEFVRRRRLRAICFYPTEACNLKCIWCNSNGRELTHIADDRARLLFRVGRTLGLRAVNFSGGGEPTLHPTFVELTRAARSYSLQTSLVTNGTTLLDIPDDVLAGMTWIRVSVNSGRGHYAAIHGKDCYDLVLEGLRRLATFKGVKRGVSCVWSGVSDLKDVQSMLRDVAGFDLDHIRIAPELFLHPGRPTSAIPASELQASVGGLRLLIESPRMVEVPQKCFTQWYKPVVDANGKVYACTLRLDHLCTIESMEEYWTRGAGVDVARCEWCHFSDVNHALMAAERIIRASDADFM